MPTPTQDTPRQDLRSVISHAEAEAQRLIETAGSAPLDAVGWLSAHLGALERAVYPVVRRELADGPQLIARHREISARLARILRVVERHHSGDVLASGLSSERLLSSLHGVLDEHLLAQTEMVDRLETSLSDPARAALVESYAGALEHAPTRPHPHLARGWLMFRVDSLRDRILDAMDGRHVPVPRLVKPHITPGRWGSYFLGQPHDEPDEPR